MQQQLACMLCSQQYTSENPPRTIECGHSLCQSCIKQALANDQQQPHTLTCPQDQQIIYLKGAILSQFPKNLTLIKLLSQFGKKQGESPSSKILSEQTISNKVPAADDSEDQETTREAETEKTGSSVNLEDSCLIHEKPLEIVCIQDKTKICSSCAIFGKHKGHEFKSLEDVEKDKLEACDMILSVIEKKESLQVKMNSKESKEKHIRQLGERKEVLIKEIKEKFCTLSRIVSLAEKKTLEKLEKVFQGIGPQVSELKFSDKTSRDYEEWAEEAFKYIQAFESNDLEEQLELLNYQKKEKENVVENGVKVLKELQREFGEVFEKTDETILESVVIEYKSDIDLKLANYCTVTTYEQKQKAMGQAKGNDKESRIKSPRLGREREPEREKQEPKRSLNSSRAELREIKMSRIDPIPSENEQPFISPRQSVHLQERKSAEKQKQPRKISDHNDDLLIEEHKSEEKVESLVESNIEILPAGNLIPFQFPNINIDQEGRYTNRRADLSPIAKQSEHNESMNGSFIKNLGTKRNPIKGNIVPSKTKRNSKLKLPEKYQKVYDSILSDTAEIADFTNGELGDPVIAMILEAMKGKKVKTLKLIRNKITDEGMDKVWGCLENIITLNLSQNNLTDRFIDQLLHNLPRLPNLRSVILSQNKIRERNVKGRIEEIKKHEITVSI